MIFQYDKIIQEQYNALQTYRLENFPDAGRRRDYLTREGIKYPSVSTILKEGIPEPEGLIKWRERVGEAEAARVSKVATTRGTGVHDVIERYVAQDNSGWDKDLSFILKEEFAPVKKILDENIDLIGGVEMPVYSDYLKTAGKFDCLGKWNGTWSIIDFKTSKRAKKDEWIHNYYLQAAAYSYMVYEQFGIVCPQLVILIAVDHDKPQVFIKRARDWLPKFIEVRQKVAEEKNI